MHHTGGAPLGTPPSLDDRLRCLGTAAVFVLLVILLVLLARLQWPSQMQTGIVLLRRLTVAANSG